MTTETRRVVDAYHAAWTSQHFDDAIALLAPTLEVDVPMNDYATPESFGAALTSFGRRVESVNVLSAMVADDEAMLMYDMSVAGLGPLRVVEHFTVANGMITRIRHVHDTAGLRHVGHPPSPPATLAEDSYAAEISVATDAERVFSTLTTLDGIAGWWTSQVSGRGSAGGQLDLGFVGLDEQVTMTVEAAVPSSMVVWRCDQHTGHPEWEGTTITFAITPRAVSKSTLRVQHDGLVPSLRCYEQCFAGWAHFLRSIKAYAEDGAGMPFDRR
jgi:uncharacterized protein YndB with AHSA1/START domain